LAQLTISVSAALVGFQAAPRCVAYAVDRAAAGSTWQLAAPRAGPPLMSQMTVVSYDQYRKERTEEDGDKPTAENDEPAAAAPPQSFGASSALVCDPEMVEAAQEAAESAGLGEQFSGSEIAIAFNSWKLCTGKNFPTADAEALELRAFASNAIMISEHLKAAEGAVFLGGLEPTVDVAATDGVNWMAVYNQAAAQRTNAEKAWGEAVAGRAAANDKLRQAQLLAQQAEEEASTIAQKQFQIDLTEAEEEARRARTILAQQLAQVAVDEREKRQQAESNMATSLQNVRSMTSAAITAAEADMKGAIHKWAATEEQAQANLKAAELDMAHALSQAQAQEAAAKMAAEKRSAAALAAQSEAKALLEMLKRTQEKAAMDVARAEQEKKDMEQQVKVANRRAQKAKLAAAAALEDL